MLVHPSLSQRLWRLALYVICTFGFALQVAPIIVIAPISFTSGSFLHYPLPGFSLKWYEVLLEPFPWMLAFRNSLLIASVTTVLATVLGTLAAYGLVRINFRGKGVVQAFLVFPIMVPVVILALGIYFFFAQLQLVGTYVGMILAYTVLAAPFVFITVSATLQGFDWTIVRAAQSLGASPVSAFRTVTLPIILPGVLSGAIFAFVTAFDEIVIAIFIASPAQYTLPRQLFSGLRSTIDPSIISAAMVMFFVSVSLLAVVELLRLRAQRITSSPTVS